MPSRLSFRHAIAAGFVTLGLSACGNIVGLTALHDGICTPGATQECPYTGPQGTQNVGTCKAGTQTCNSDGQGWGACYGEVTPIATLNCKSSMDATCGTVSRDQCCAAPATVSCYDGPKGTEGVASCKGGMKTCAADTYTWGACEGEVLPGKEDCYAIGDEDCDGNACSDPVWDMVFDDSNGESVTGFAIDSKGDVYIAGSFNYYLGVDGQMIPDTDISTGESQYYLVKLSHQAPHHMLWYKRIGDDKNNGQVIRVVVDGSDNVIIGGEMWSSVDFGNGTPLTSPDVSAFIAKYDSSGNYQWGKLFGGPAGAQGTSVTVDSKGGIILGGYWFGGTLDFATTSLTAPSSAGQYGFVAGFDANGVNKWSINLQDTTTNPPPKTSSVVVTSVAADPTDPNSVYVAGSFNEQVHIAGKDLYTSGGYDIFLMKVDGMGTPMWTQVYGSAQDDGAGSVAVSGQGDVALAGGAGGTITVGTKMLAAGGFTAVFDPTGAPVWAVSAPSGLATFDKTGNVFYAGGSGAVSVGKLDTKGGDLWHKSFTNSSGSGSNVHALAVDPSTGNVAIAGTIVGSISFGLPALTGSFNGYLAEFQY